MAKTTSPLFPQTERILQDLGERVMLARKKRGLTSKLLAERAGMTAVTLRSLERGSPGVTMGAYAAVLQALKLEDDLNLIAKDDPIGNGLIHAALQTTQKLSIRSKKS
ncbi:MAG: helix-turn-helix transcriptional regulator [Limnobacter sp.]|nr:helix-turn-helix transcriptional regulator [Limnobacter sp.]